MGEFKEQCHRLHLGLLAHETEKLFNAICKSEDKQGNKATEDLGARGQIKGFSYRQFVRTFYKFRNVAMADQVFSRIYTTAKDRKISWKQQFTHGPPVASAGGKTTKKETKAKAAEVTLNDLKPLLRNLKLGLTAEELDAVVNSFEMNVIPLDIWEARLAESHKKVESASREKNLLIHSLVTQIQEAISRESIPLDRLFFDFDENQTGTLELRQLSNMVAFLRILASKHQLKTLFDAIDYDRKGYISLNEFRNFMEESNIQQQALKSQRGKYVESENEEENKLNNIYMSIKENLEKHELTLQRVIDNLGYKPNEVLTKVNLEKVLFAIQVTLKKDELELFYHKIENSSRNSGVISFEDFQSFALREQIEVINFDKKHHHIHPSISIFIEKMNLVFRNVQITPRIAFRYFSAGERESIPKKAFFNVIQSMGISFTKEDLLIFYEFFDEKGFGEISASTFSEKFEAFAYININRLQTQSDNDKEEAANIKRMSMKQQVIGLLQKIYFALLEKRYNKRQMIAVFDKNGNGMLSREDFMEGLKALRINIPLDKASIMMNFLDKNDNGIIEIEEFVQALYESVPQNMQQTFKMSQAMGILRKVVDKLKDHSNYFLTDLVKCEKVVNTQEGGALSRTKTGINTLDFFKLLKEYSMALSEEDKAIVKGAFTLRSNANFLDIENIYNQIELLISSRNTAIMEELTASGVTVDNEAAVLEFSDQTEIRIYRRIGEELRKRNMTVEQAFAQLDIDKNGFITHDEFQQLFKSLGLTFTNRELNYLTSQYTQIQGRVALDEFKKKFWKAFTETGFLDGVDRLKDAKTYQRKVVAFVLSTLKDKRKYSLEYTWAKMDQAKRGYITIEDVRKALIELKIFISKIDLASLFNFMDYNQKGRVDFFEFVDFWHQTASVYDLAPERQNELTNLERDIFEHLAKVVNQREISLYDLYLEIDPGNKGYMTDRDFGFLLHKLGLTIPEDKIEQLMKLIDTNADRRIAFSDLETKLLQYGMKIFQESVKDRINWIDKSLKKLMLALSHEIRSHYQEYFTKFDSDFDGFLTPEEFYKAIKNLKTTLSENQLQRLANNFQTKHLDNRLSIERMKEVFDYASRIQDMRGNQFDVASMSQNLFTYLMTHYEGLSIMFKVMGDVRKNTKDMEKYLRQRRFSIRGFKLLALKEIFTRLNDMIKFIMTSLQKGLNLALRQSNELIVKSAMSKYIDPAINALTVDKDQLRLCEQIIQQVQIFQLGDNQSFNIDYESIEFVTPFIKKFKGYYFRLEQPIDIQVYEKDVIMATCADGNQFLTHLEFELKIHKMASEKGDYFFKTFAKFEKKVGLEVTEKDVYLLNEYIDPTKWISIEELMLQNGGLLRIPFLTRTKATIFILKYWASQILRIMNTVQDLGCALVLMRPDNIYVSRDGQKIKFKSLKGVSKINDIGKLSLIPDFKLNLKGDMSNVSKEEPISTDKDTLDRNDAYLAPEMIFNNPFELTQAVDSWTFGCLLYQILFGKPPASFYSRIVEECPSVKDDISSFTYPSNYFHHNLYPDELINDILKCDYELDDVNASTLKAVDAVSGVTYNSMFQNVIHSDPLLHKDKFDKSNKEMLNQIGCYLDIIAACLSYSPSSRPTIHALLSSPIFTLDKYETMISKQYGEIMIFYKSPSLNVRDRVLIPLRKISALVIEKRKNVVRLEEELLTIMDIVNLCLTERRSMKTETLKKNLTKTFNSSKMEYYSQADFSYKGAKDESQNLSIFGLTDSKLSERTRAPNHVLVKFIFEHGILDLLVFLTLRHHSESRHIYEQTKKKGRTKPESAVRLVRGLCEVFRTIIFDMASFESTCAPFVHIMVENLCKFVLGEEYKLASDCVDLRGETVTTYFATKNTYKEYESKKNPIYQSFFRNKDDSVRDEADEAWSKHTFSRPYVFSESHWTPELYAVVGPVYKDSISEAGVGASPYPVIQDYIRKESENNHSFEFDVQSRVDEKNRKGPNHFHRSSDYFNDVMQVAYDLEVISFFGISKGKSDLNFACQHIKALLQTGHTDKIKLVLDSKIITKLIPFLGYTDPAIRFDLLEILYEASCGFERDLMSLNTVDRNIMLKNVEQNLKTIGSVSQLTKQTLRDQSAQTKVISSSYDYAALNRQINSKYVKEIAEIFESPATISLMFTMLKTQAELLENKELVLRIFENLTNGPLNVIRALNGGYMDVFSVLSKTLVTEMKGVELKQNKVLAPKLVPIFQKIINDCRPELVDMLSNTPGIRALLKDRNLEVPPKLDLDIIQEKLAKNQEFFITSKDFVIQEIQSFILAGKLKTRNLNDARLKALASNIDQFSNNLISYLKYYYNQGKGRVTITDVKTCIEEAVELFMSIYDKLSDYTQIHESVVAMVMQIGHFFEWIATSEHIEFFLDSKDTQRLSKIMNWMMEKINTIYNYYQNVDKDEDQPSKERTYSQLGKTDRSVSGGIDELLTRESLKRYSSNKLTPVAQGFMRIFLHIVSLNKDAYNTTLSNIEFATFFAQICKEQFWVLSASIKTHTENVQLILNYAEEARIRQKLFEKLLMSSAKELHQQIVAAGFMHLICDSYLNNHHEVNIAAYKLPFKVLPFKNFLPLRNEALSILISVIHHKATAEFVYKDTILALTRYNNMKIEYENLLKYKKGLTFTSALHFFNIIIDIEDEQIHLLMKQEGIFRFLKNLLDSNIELRYCFSSLAQKLEKIDI